MSTPTNSSDKDLIDRYLEGDLDAFARLVGRWERRVVNLAHRLTGDIEEARDIGQLTFVKVFRGLRSFNGESRFSTWLYTIALNASRDRMRRRAARSGLTAAWAESIDLHTPKRASERRETASIVSRAVASLPEAEREVVVLRHYQDRTFAEIASIVGAPVSTVKSRMERAIRKLRPRLKGLEN